jgi:hypothetical protein
MNMKTRSSDPATKMMEEQIAERGHLDLTAKINSGRGKILDLTDTRALTANSPQEQISGENGPAGIGPKENQSGKSLKSDALRPRQHKPEKPQRQRLRVCTERKNPQTGTVQTPRSTVTTKKKIR